ncbi:MAG TPA: HepT-like ribonuclease domain-containing protein [Gammaproteobacteria bacterium]|nr:HepT-like ribonuclease domain-containing protein [Gammaproteobacteria bacterium]
MTSGISVATRNALQALARATPDLDLLLLHGSRARGDVHAGSDWDFAYLGGARLDVAALLAAIVEAIHDDRLDLADLATAGGLLRYRAAPANYGDAFRLLQSAGVIEAGLAGRLVREAGFRNIVAHAYGSLDMARVYDAATNGPDDLRAFLRHVRDRTA